VDGSGGASRTADPAHDPRLEPGVVVDGSGGASRTADPAPDPRLEPCVVEDDSGGASRADPATEPPTPVETGVVEDDSGGALRTAEPSPDPRLEPGVVMDDSSSPPPCDASDNDYDSSDNNGNDPAIRRAGMPLKLPVCPQKRKAPVDDDPGLRPLDRNNLIGRFVKIPRASFPQWACSEYGGSGWRGKVVSVKKKRGAIMVGITDGWKVGAEASHVKSFYDLRFVMELEVVE